jgi:hypothetical protein
MSAIAAPALAGSNGDESTGPSTATTRVNPAVDLSTSLTPKPDGIAGSWKLVFDDEFNENSLNRHAWSTHNGYTHQNNVTDHAGNVTVSGGYAALTLASRRSGAAIETISASLGVGDVAEARIEFAGAGPIVYNWPAFWTAGPHWPASGENDIAEGLGSLTVNYHSLLGTQNEGTVSGVWVKSFHTYAVKRLAHKSEVFWDGKRVKTYRTHDDGGPQHLIFTVGSGAVLVTGYASRLLVDYARIWAPAHVRS